MSHALDFTIPDYSHAARIVQRGLATLSELCRWIAHTGDPDLPPAPRVSGCALRDAARALRTLATDLETLANRLDPSRQEREASPGSGQPGDKVHERPQAVR